MSWRKGETFEDRFWRKVEKTETCWNWNATTDRFGYGRVYVGTRLCPAHRVAYELAKGPIPDGLMIDHRCHNKSCVNPDHLRQVTRKQNLEHRSGPTSTSKSGFRGVSWHKGTQKWQAQVVHNRETYYLGYFTDPALAGAVAAAKRNGLFTHNDVDRRQ